jgi:hypothetical protein
MATGRLALIRKKDGTTRRVGRVFRSIDVITPVPLDDGEELITEASASTLVAQILSGGEAPDDETLLKDMNAAMDFYEKGEFVDITDELG